MLNLNVRQRQDERVRHSVNVKSSASHITLAGKKIQLRKEEQGKIAAVGYTPHSPPPKSKIIDGVPCGYHGKKKGAWRERCAYWHI